MLGTVTMLRRYPVKSMLGEDIAASDVTGRGWRTTGRARPPRDRPGRQREEPAAVAGPAQAGRRRRLRQWPPTPSRRCRCRCRREREYGVQITLPDGKTVWSADAGIDAVLSDVLGLPVTQTGTPPPNAELDRAVPEEVLRDGITARVAVETGRLGGGSPAGTFFDFAPIHLLTTSTLGRIAELSPRGVAEVERYRPNIVVRTDGAGFTENDWAGHDLLIGTELVLGDVAHPALRHPHPGARRPAQGHRRAARAGRA